MGVHPMGRPATTHAPAALLVVLVAINLAVWAIAIAVFRQHPLCLGTALIAYSFGLRHGFDADHISAIDNAIRKLIQSGRRPLAAGTWFSLGHSTIVVLLSLAIVFATAAIRSRFTALTEFGAFAGMLISGGLLIAIGIANAAILLSLFRVRSGLRRGIVYDQDHLERLLAGRGFMARLFRRVFKLVGRSWHMYFVGLLFGLGFDTATEIGLLGISAAEASRGLPLAAIMMFPALFAAGMALVDTADSVVMVDTCSRVIGNPARNLLYNIVVTGLSVVTAFAVGGIELLRLLKAELDLSAPQWRWIDGLNVGLGWGGFVIVAVFLALWLAARIRRDDIAP